MTTERQRRIAQQRLFHEGDYPALIASLAGRLMALEAHAVKHGYELPQEADPLSAVLERAERARENIEAYERPEGTDDKLPPASNEDADFVRSFLHDGEAYGDAEARLIVEAASLNNRLMSGMIDGAGRDRLGLLTRLFTVTKRIAVDAL